MTFQSSNKGQGAALSTGTRYGGPHCDAKAPSLVRTPGGSYSTLLRQMSRRRQSTSSRRSSLDSSSSLLSLRVVARPTNAYRGDQSNTRGRTTVGRTQLQQYATYRQGGAQHSTSSPTTLQSVARGGGRQAWQQTQTRRPARIVPLLGVTSDQLGRGNRSGGGSQSRLSTQPDRYYNLNRGAGMFYPSENELWREVEQIVRAHEAAVSDYRVNSTRRRRPRPNEGSNADNHSAFRRRYEQRAHQQMNLAPQQRGQQATGFDPGEFASARLLNEFPRLQNDTNPVLYEQIAADDKRIYEQDGLLWMRTNPTADPREVPLNYSTPYEIKLVAPGSEEQTSIAYLKVSEVRSGSYCVRYIEHYNRTMPFWLGELHSTQNLRSKGITPKPPRCGPATDASYYNAAGPPALPGPYVVRRASDEPLPLYYAEEPPAYTSRSRPPSYRRKLSEIEDHAKKVEESQPQSTFHSIRRHLRKSKVKLTNRIRPQSTHPIV